MVGGALAVAEEGDGGLAAVGDVDAVYVAVVLDDGFHGGLPEDTLVAAAAPAGAELHAEEVGVLELGEEDGALAEVAPDGMVDDLEAGGAARPQRRRVGLQLQDEAILVINHLLPDAHRVGEQVSRRLGVQPPLVRMVRACGR